MKRLKKILLLAVAMLLAAVISITATIAYLKSQTDVEQNAFAVGKVKISLDEAKVNENGQPVDEDGNVVALADAPRVYENKYKLIPGRTYIKAPTVHVAEDSEDCWLFVLMYIPNSLRNVVEFSNFGNSEDLSYQIYNINGWLTGFKHALPSGLNAGEYLLYRQPQVTKGGTDIQFFSSITIKETATYDQLKDVDLSEIVITAYAVQYEGFENMDETLIWNNIIIPAFNPYDLHID